MAKSSFFLLKFNQTKSSFFRLKYFFFVILLRRLKFTFIWYICTRLIFNTNFFIYNIFHEIKKSLCLESTVTYVQNVYWHFGFPISIGCMGNANIFCWLINNNNFSWMLAKFCAKFCDKFLWNIAIFQRRTLLFKLSIA